MTRARSRVATGLIAAAALLAGCRTIPTPPVIGPGADAPWPAQRAGLEKLDRYGLSGRVAVAANGQGFTANLRYEQQAQRSDLALDGPLGIGGVRMAIEGDDLRIETSGGKQLDGAAARAELERRLGFELPLKDLRWWLLGIPAPGDAAVTADADSGEIHDFTQHGWRVSIDSRAAGLGFALPQRLSVERMGVERTGVARTGVEREVARLKLIVEQWQP